MFWPAMTGDGVALAVTETSACVPEATTSVKVAELLAGIFSELAEDTVAVLAIRVPAAVPPLTVRVMVNVVLAPGIMLAIVQVTVPPEGVPQDHPAPDIVPNVVLAGIVSTSVAAPESDGPLFVTTCVSVIVPPAVTGLGVPVFVTAISTAASAVVFALAVLFDASGSPFEVATVVVFVTTVLFAVEDGTSTSNCKVATAPTARLAVLHVKVPPLGAVHDQPGGTVIDW
jgi:hypothetical protein